MLLEGDAGVGKTDAARALASVFGAQLLRLQCYEGLDLAAAAYDWNYGKQLLAIRAAEGAHERAPDLYGDEFLIRRPLLAALSATRSRGIVLLIDEIDRADDEFEAFLLEFLGRFRDLDPRARHGRGGAPSDRRAHLEPNARSARRAQATLLLPLDRAPGGRARDRDPTPAPAAALAGARRATSPAPPPRCASANCARCPGYRESIDWAQTLQLLGAERLDAEVFEPSLGSVLKYPEDIELARASAAAIVGRARDRWTRHER